MKSIDFIIIIIFGIVVSVIIGFSIVSVVDSKISSVSINVPPIKLPSPTVIVKLERSDGGYDIYVDKNNDKGNYDKLSNTNLEHFDSVKPENSNTIDIKEKRSANNVEFPDHDNIVRYGQYTCYRNDRDAKPEEPAKTTINKPIDIQNVCQNEFVYKNNSYRVIKDGSHASSTEGCNMYVDNENDIDPGEYYKSKVSIIKSYFEDPRLRGYNVLSSDNYAGIKEIGRIDLTKKTQHPSGFGSV